MNRSTAGIALTALLFVVAISAVTCKKSSNPTGPGGGGGADVTINIVANSGSSSFSPNPDTVTVGQTVAWHNGLSDNHTSTSSSWNTGLIAGGGTSAPVTMSTVGSFAYHCGVHPTMVGTLVVQ